MVGAAEERSSASLILSSTSGRAPRTAGRFEKTAGRQPPARDWDSRHTSADVVEDASPSTRSRGPSDGAFARKRVSGTHTMVALRYPAVQGKKFTPGIAT